MLAQHSAEHKKLYHALVMEKKWTFGVFSTLFIGRGGHVLDLQLLYS